MDQTNCSCRKPDPALLFLPLQLAKSPWVAAWDRLVRVLLRLELWAGGLSRDSSALQEAFEAAAESGQRTAQLSSSGADSDGDRAEGELCITASELEEVCWVMQSDILCLASVKLLRK